MPEKPKPDEPTEKTPKGLTVPVPRREAFFDNLKKVAKPEALKKVESGHHRGKGGRRPPPRTSK